ncbi:MAG: (2Fe-2S)-binding protein [Phycisphaerae bacterium]|nr:(2Fe-2S)-binding protein [Phycisphaerae bacterium]
MPKITIDGKVREFKPGQVILQIANEAGQDIPQYCYHEGLSIVASCRICLAEVWMPNPRNGGKLEPYMGGKLLPTCQTQALDGMVVFTDSPKALANQKAVMEYLLINHPLDCPVCDQAGECTLQDYSYEYGRGASRFEETKVKQPKKDVGPDILLYSDRCIMCTRCVRFTREVAGTGELCVAGRGNKEEIDVFPGRALDNPIAGNVVDLCPVGALLDKDFLFAQRVWFLKRTPSIDGITASGDNIYIEHNEGRVYRVKPRTNMAINKWWITDEVRHGWKFIHSQDLLSGARRKQFGVRVECEWGRGIQAAVEGLRAVANSGKRLAVVVSPMLPSEEAFLLARAALALDPKAFLALGPVPVQGQDRFFPPDTAGAFRLCAEKCPNARGVRRTLEAISRTTAHSGYVASFEQVITQLRSGEVGGIIVTGNYPSDWATPEFESALSGAFLVLLDTLPGRLLDRADVVLPGVTWAEKAGSFENCTGVVQAFEAAIPALDGASAEGQSALAMIAEAADGPRPGGWVNAPLYNAADVRARIADGLPELAAWIGTVRAPAAAVEREPDMAVVEL